MKKESNGGIETIIVINKSGQYSVVSAVNSDGEEEKNLTGLSSVRAERLANKLIKGYPENTTTSSELFDKTLALQERIAEKSEFNGVDGEITKIMEKAEINRAKREQYDLKMANGGVLQVKKEEPKALIGVDFTTIYANGDEIIVVQKDFNGITSVVMAQKAGKDIPALLSLDNEKAEKLNGNLLNIFNGALTDGKPIERQIERVMAQNINSSEPQYIQMQIDRQMNKKSEDKLKGSSPVDLLNTKREEISGIKNQSLGEYPEIKSNESSSSSKNKKLKNKYEV